MARQAEQATVGRLCRASWVLVAQVVSWKTVNQATQTNGTWGLTAVLLVAWENPVSKRFFLSSLARVGLS